MTICILGRQPALGLAELESLFGAKNVSVISGGIAQVNLPVSEVAKNELGGTIKVAKHITTLDTTKWDQLVDYCYKTLPEHLQHFPAEGKIKFGLSEYGLKVPLKSLQKGGLTLKKAVRQAGRSVRVVPNTENALNSASVLHNQLTSELGLELLFIKSGNQTLLAQTVQEQDIESYAYRDRKRPKRDTFVGMLPPKLSQIMINLATPQPGATILDPFCGTGVLLMEAALMGHRVYGTDISERMIKYSDINLGWLAQAYKLKIDGLVEVGDATTTKWQQPIDNIACETYLGQPLSGLPKPEKLEEIIHGCNQITKGFLKNVATQVKPGSSHCIAVPAWRVGDTFKHLPVLEKLEELGFAQKKLAHVANSDLIYFRPDQIVARELLVLEKL